MGIDSTKTKRRAGRDQAALLLLAPDAVLTLAEAALLCAISLRHLTQERALGRGPRTYRLGPRAVRTTRADVEAWVRSRAEGSAGR